MLSMAIASMWASMAAWFTPTILFCATNLIIATIFIASNNQTKHHHHDNNNINNNNNNNYNVNNIPPTRISRVSSLILDRARSFKLPSYPATITTESQHYPSEQPKTATYSSNSRLAQSIHQPLLYTPEPETIPLSQPGYTPSLFQRVKSIKFTSESDNSNNNNNINPPGQGQLTRPPSFLDRVRSFRIYSGSAEPDPGLEPEHNVVKNKNKNKNKNKKKNVGNKLKVEMKKSRSEMNLVTSDEEEEEEVEIRRPATARVRGSNEVDEEVDARADDFISRFRKQLKLQRVESLMRNNQMLNRSS